METLQDLILARLRMVHDGKPVIESSLICEYIDAAFPQGPATNPADPWFQARMRLWSKMVDEGLHDGVTELSFSAMFRERMKNMPPDVRERNELHHRGYGRLCAR
jgi:glutathione S-transferase